MEEEAKSLQHTPTWVIAAVCFVIVLLSICAERGLHKLGKFLKNNDQDALFESLQKLKEELMLLGFISLLLTVTQNSISRICIPAHLATTMLPCKTETESSHHEKVYGQVINNRRQLLSSSNSAEHCASKGQAQLVSVEALHQLHIFIFVLAVVHVIFCVSTMVLGGLRIRQWKEWEDSIRHPSRHFRDPEKHAHEHHYFHLFIKRHEKGYWRRSAVISWVIAFFKQFYASITKSDYIALRKGFMATHCPQVADFDFHKYMMRTLQVDFKRIVTISWYLWLFIVIFLLLNVEGWHTFFWLAFLPVILLLLVGAKLEHIITSLGHRVTEIKPLHIEAARIQPSDEHFWLESPAIFLDLIQFILFQNSFEIAFFFWIWSTYGFHSCVMERLGYIVPRLIMGLFVQVLCSYSTLPLYALVSQMGTKFRKGMFGEDVQSALEGWAGSVRTRRDTTGAHMDKLITESSHGAEQEMVVIDGITASITKQSSATQASTSSNMPTS